MIFKVGDKVKLLDNDKVRILGIDLINASGITFYSVRSLIDGTMFWITLNDIDFKLGNFKNKIKKVLLI